MCLLPDHKGDAIKKTIFLLFGSMMIQIAHFTLLGAPVFIEKVQPPVLSLFHSTIRRTIKVFVVRV